MNTLSIYNVINTLKPNPNSAVRWNKRKLSGIKSIVLHQALGTKTVEDTNAYSISEENHIAPGVGLPKIPYHFFINFPDGKIYQCNNFDDLTWTVVNHNHEVLSVCFGGDFNYIDVTGQEITQRDHNPSDAQIESAKLLVPYLQNILKLTNKDVYTHNQKQPGGKPACPGIKLAAFVDQINAS